MPLLLNAEHDADLDRAAAALRSGRLVALPTETVYGLGADALNPTAVARIFAVKDRPTFDPLIVHLAEAADALALAAAWPALAVRLAEAFWPGSLTMVLPKRALVPDLVTAGMGTVALRVPDHEATRAVIRRAGVPVAAPSANRFGAVSPTRVTHVMDELGAYLAADDVILDGGACRAGVESTVIGLTDDAECPVLLLRPGAVTVEAIEAVLGQSLWRAGESERTEATHSAPEQPRPAPGMLDRHYAPRTPLRLFTNTDDQGVANALRQTPGAARLELPGDPTAAAAALYDALRQLDANPAVTSIVAQRFPEAGLGRAINDRLQRGATAT